MKYTSGLKKMIDAVKATIDEQMKNGDDDTPWIKHVAMLSGVLAALTGFLAVRVTSLTNDAIYESNQAILAQTQSSDAWAEYQADSIKARVVETALAASNGIDDDKEKWLKAEAAELRGRQPALKQRAIDKEKERDDRLKAGLGRLGEKDLLGYASLAAQIGIGLASVAALVHMRKLYLLGAVIGSFSLAIAVYAYMAHVGAM